VALEKRKMLKHHLIRVLIRPCHDAKPFVKTRKIYADINKSFLSSKSSFVETYILIKQLWLTKAMQLFFNCGDFFDSFIHALKILSTFA
jgi:hypothetical protein